MAMGKNRLEAFSDGVLAIIITIMVLELKVPHGEGLDDLLPKLPTFLSYILSFIYVGIYWNNHHHLLHTVRHVSGMVLWSNLHLLFWLSLLPFATDWMGENHFAPMPTSLYGFVMLMSALAFCLLEYCIIATDGNESLLKKAISSARKEKISIALYLIAIILSFFYHFASLAIYMAVAVMWLVPDKRIEHHLSHEN